MNLSRTSVILPQINLPLLNSSSYYPSTHSQNPSDHSPTNPHNHPSRTTFSSYPMHMCVSHWHPHWLCPMWNLQSHLNSQYGVCLSDHSHCIPSRIMCRSSWWHRRGWHRWRWLGRLRRGGWRWNLRGLRVGRIGHGRSILVCLFRWWRRWICDRRRWLGRLDRIECWC